jgi:hypothetical protein
VPRRTRRPPLVPDVAVEERLEHLRRGTATRYESPWFLLRATTTAKQAKAVTHQLGRIPSVVDVQTAVSPDASNVADGNSSVIVTKDRTEITIQSDIDNDAYFKVSAF